MPSSTRRDLAIVLLVCALAFWWRLGRLGLIDPDEPFYAQTATEMLARHDWVTPYIFDRPQFEKPPLFYWLSCASFAVLGRTELAARAPGALFATLLVLLTWAFGRRALGRRDGLLAAVVLASGVAFALTARIMLTDVVFSAFVCAACLAFWRAVEPPGDPAASGGGRPGRGRGGWLALAFIASALAVITKGPLGLLIPAMAAIAWMGVTRRALPVRGREAALGVALFLLIATPWYATMLGRYGGEYYRAFFVHENLDRLFHAEHPANNRLDYYPAVLLLGSFPWMPALAVTLLRARRAAADRGVALFLWCWILTSFAFLTLVQSKLPTYILFLFVPLALLTGSSLAALLRDGFRSRAERGVAITLAALQALGVLAVLGFRGYAAFFVPAAAAALPLVAAVVLLGRRPSAAWVATSALATVALIVTATGGAATAVEAMTSARPAAQALERQDAPGVPVLCSAFLVRGVYYYTHRGARVLSNRERPFFTPHPIPVVLGAPGLREFVRVHGPTVCVMRAKEWREIRSRAPQPVPDDSLRVGDKLIVRVARPAD